MKNAFDFLKKLKKNNNKEWFNKNRKNYEEAKTEFEELITGTLSKIAKFDKGVAGLEAKKTMFRINRDVRFSKDKSPYKTNMGASMNPGGRNSMIAGYYLHVQPGNSFLAGGSYMPMPDKLTAIRQEIDYDFKGFKKILEQKDFKKYFGGLSDEGKLVNPPKGYDKENPAVEFLKHKHFIAFHKIDDPIVLSSKFQDYAANVFKAMHPFVLFLRKAME